MRKDKNVPKIRFKEFDTEWSSSTLADEGTFYYGRSCPKWSVTKDATIPCIRYGELYTKFGAKIDKVYSYTNISPDNLRFSNGLEVLIPRVGEDPKDYNHCTWLSIPNVAIGEMISVYNTINNPLFTSIMLNATMQDEFAKRVEGGSVTNLYYEKLKNIKVFFPSKLEQEKIGSYFENIDNLISLQKQKYEKLLNLKKAMLNKLFPKEGENTPEIRFDGFIDEWEKKKLLEFGESTSGVSMESEFNKNGQLKVISIGSYSENSKYIDQGIRSSINNKTSNRILSKDDLTMILNDKTASGNIIGRVLLIEENNKYIYNQRTERIEIYKEKFNPNFLYQMLNSNYIRSKIIKLAQGNTQIYVNWSTIKEIEYLIPRQYNEQKTIGEYFSKLDKLIELNKAKLEKLKNIKSSLLDNMFV